MGTSRSLEVAVEGGRLRVGIWGDSGPLVMASHGLTATHVSFQALADALEGSCRLVAPDHRGRGRSSDITGPWGMAAHAADLLAILDHLGEARADLLLGHSMGGFVAAVAGARAPERVARLLLVDGGLPTIDKLPVGVSTESLIQAVLGPALQRLDMQFASLDAHRAFWREHPAFADQWSSYVEQYADYDLIGEPPRLQSSVRKEAVVRDVETQLHDDLIPTSLEALRQPVRFLQAPRGVMNGDPLYHDTALEEWAQRIPHFERAVVPDVNHFTIVISPRGAEALADEVRAALAS